MCSCSSLLPLQVTLQRLQARVRRPHCWSEPVVSLSRKEKLALPASTSLCTFMWRRR